MTCEFVKGFIFLKNVSGSRIQETTKFSWPEFRMKVEKAETVGRGGDLA